MPLLKPLFTSHTIPESLLVFLLDWSEPWSWVRQLRDWIRLIKGVTASLDNAASDVMEQVMQEWQKRKRGVATHEAMSSASGTQSDVTLPLGQGEWDEPLGIPVCVVCHGVSCSAVIENAIKAKKLTSLNVGRQNRYA